MKLKVARVTKLAGGQRVHFRREGGLAGELKAIIMLGSHHVGDMENVPQDLDVHDGSEREFMEARAAEHGLIASSKWDSRRSFDLFDI